MQNHEESTQGTQPPLDHARTRTILIFDLSAIALRGKVLRELTKRITAVIPGSSTLSDGAFLLPSADLTPLHESFQRLPVGGTFNYFIVHASRVRRGKITAVSMEVPNEM